MQPMNGQSSVERVNRGKDFTRCGPGFGTMRRWSRYCHHAARALLLCGACVSVVAMGQQATSSESEARSLTEWLAWVHDAARQRTFTGTLVISSDGELATSKVWHACDGVQQMERVEVLTGAPRTIVRRNSDVITFEPDSKVARLEKRESIGIVPELLRTQEGPIADHYRLHAQGDERVAGHMAQVFLLAPKDSLRFGYKVWVEKKSGLLLKLQTLGLQQQVMEQVAFTELQLDAPVSMAALKAHMANTQGYRVETTQLQKTTPEAQGWRLRQPVAGFVSLSCHTAAAPGVLRPLQWVFSDGLASVSLFLEPFDAQRHRVAGASASGATHVLTRRLGAYWLTAMGEVPPGTLVAFADRLERTR